MWCAILTGPLFYWCYRSSPAALLNIEMVTACPESRQKRFLVSVPDQVYVGLPGEASLESPVRTQLVVVRLVSCVTL